MTRVRINPAKYIITLAFAVLLIFPCASEGAISVVGGLTREMKVEPGEAYRGAIVITNTGDEYEEVKIYQTDYVFYCDGSKTYGKPGEHERSNAGWISFAPSRLEIPAHESATVNYEIRVPAGESLLGSYWSILMVEVIGKGSPEAVASKPSEFQVGVRQVFRYGVQMVAQVEDKATCNLRFDTKLIRRNGKRILRMDVENFGDKWARPLAWAELYDATGTYMGRFEGNRLRVYPGTCATTRIDLTYLPEGTYKALIIIDAGGDDVFGANVTLKLKKSPQSGP